MNRIKPEQVVRSYQATQLIPAFDEWYDPDKNCGCGLTAVLMNEDPDFSISLLVEMDEKTMSEKLNLNFHYVCGFVEGFDATLPPSRGSIFGYDKIDEYKTGYADGKLARNMIWNEVGVCML